jgi:hypothetical protein
MSSKNAREIPILYEVATATWPNLFLGILGAFTMLRFEINFPNVVFRTHFVRGLLGG